MQVCVYNAQRKYLFCCHQYLMNNLSKLMEASTITVLIKDGIYCSSCAIIKPLAIAIESAFSVLLCSGVPLAKHVLSIILVKGTSITCQTSSTRIDQYRVYINVMCGMQKFDVCSCLNVKLERLCIIRKIKEESNLLNS